MVVIEPGLARSLLEVADRTAGQRPVPAAGPRPGLHGDPGPVELPQAVRPGPGDSRCQLRAGALRAFARCSPVLEVRVLLHRMAVTWDTSWSASQARRYLATGPHGRAVVPNVFTVTRYEHAASPILNKAGTLTVLMVATAS